MTTTKQEEKVVMDLGDGIPEEVKQEGQDLQKVLEDRLSRWRGPEGSINKNGRPKGTSVFKNKTNREIREIELVSLLRKLKPFQTKAIQAAVKIIDNEEAADTNKLKASALILSHYRQLLLDTFRTEYDDKEQDKEVQSTPVFSLTMIDNSVEDVEEKK